MGDLALLILISPDSHVLRFRIILCVLLSRILVRIGYPNHHTCINIQNQIVLIPISARKAIHPMSYPSLESPTKFPVPNEFTVFIAQQYNQIIHASQIMP